MSPTADPPAAGADDPTSRRAHWDAAYADADADHSWDQRHPDRSLALLGHDLGAVADLPGPVLDVGGGTSPLTAALLDAGVAQVAVLDVSATAASQLADRLGDRADQVARIVADVTAWVPDRRYAAWHDRAVFHFLTDPTDRAAYRRTLHAAVVPGGRVVVATFAPDGPDRCSGLPTARYDGTELAAELGLVEVVIEREVHRTPWDTEQVFTWVAGRTPR